MSANILVVNQSYIDANKTNLSICSAILSAIIVFYIIYNSNLKIFVNYLPIAFFVISIIMAMYGFGRAINAIQDDKMNNAWMFTNASVFFIVIGIISLLFVKIQINQTLDIVLANIEKETSTLKEVLIPSQMESVKVTQDHYLIKYTIGSKEITVFYSKRDNRLIGYN